MPGFVYLLFLFILFSFFLRAVHSISIIIHYHKLVTSVSPRLDYLACESDTSRFQKHTIIGLFRCVLETGVQNETCSDTAGSPHKGKLQCSLGYFSAPVKAKIPFNFKVTLQEDQFESLGEEFMCLNTYKQK